jgi:YHS domain-containing protein
VNKLALAFVVASSLVACNRESSSSPSPSATASAPSSSAATLPAGMTRVADPSQVCMVNDQFMGKPQIPVEVEGRTYYGCCAMCKDKLNQQPAARMAQDPVTGESVDKSKAIIIQDASGRVKYFASEDTLSRYRG